VPVDSTISASRGEAVKKKTFIGVAFTWKHRKELFCAYTGFAPEQIEE
jgi:hypothetical protein